MPGADVEGVVALGGVAGASAEVPEIAGRGAGRVGVFVVPDGWSGQALELAPAVVVGAEEIAVLAVLVLGVAKGQHGVRVALLDDPGGGDVAASAAGWAGGRLSGYGW